MRLAAFLLVAVVINVLVVARPVVVPLVALSLWTLIPGAAASLVTGQTKGLLALAPAALMVLVGMAFAVVRRPGQLRAALQHRPEWWVLLGFVGAVSVVTGQASGLGTPSVAAAVNQVVAPVLLFLLLGAAVLERPGEVRTIAVWFVVAGVLESCLAALQLALQSPLLFSAQYEDQAFFRQNLNRWMGTLDHPLVLSFFLVVSLSFLATLRSWRLILPCSVAMSGGILVTQSRTGIALALAVMVYVTATARLPRPVHRLFVLVPLAVAGAVAVNGGLANALVARLADDTGSTGARTAALAYFVRHISDYLWLGQGMTASFNVADAAGLGTSFESSLLMYSIDLGLLPGLLYFGVMVAILMRSWGVAVVPGPTTAALVGVLVVQTFSALSVTTAVPPVLWAALATAGFGAVRPRRTPEQLFRRSGSEPHVVPESRVSARRGSPAVGAQR